MHFVAFSATLYVDNGWSYSETDKKLCLGGKYLMPYKGTVDCHWSKSYCGH